ncbi:unnamed protein product [Rhizoctonia solani]|uniref:C2H2-type domain-containing protein n=1 Tax=Rhizoctonia solani TaxID=456999 RepID=A0A8H3A6D8_9AGAM|nr:unnamed protein product [Rhizoctonia solani]
MQGPVPMPSQKRAHRPLSTLEPLSYHVPPRTNTKRPISEPISKGTVRCDESGRVDLISTNASNQKKKKLKNKDDGRCEYCPKMFAQKTARKTHENTHTGARPHYCRAAGCGRTFADPSSRTRHEKELHDPSFGFKCLRPGCEESYKRKMAFTTHMVTAHSWPDKNTISATVYTAARNKCADDYRRAKGVWSIESDGPIEGPDDGNSNDSDGDIPEPTSDEKPLFNRKRLRSASVSSEDIKPPPAKKQAIAIDPSLSRRNAVYSIELPAPQHLIGQHLGHQRSDSDDHSISTTSSFADAFSGCYQPADHRFPSGSPPQHLGSSRDYDDAMRRVQSGTVPSARGLHMRVPMPSMPNNYGVAPTSVSPNMKMPDPVHYQCSPGTNALTRSSWPAPDSSYGHSWSFDNGISQAPHGMSPAHTGHEAMSPRGVLPQAHSGVLYAASGDQPEHSSDSSLGPHYGQTASGGFREHQMLVRTPGEHDLLSYPDSHTQGMFELKPSPYDGTTDRDSRIPRSMYH